MLIRSFLNTALVTSLVALCACDKEESLGDLDGGTSTDADSEASSSGSATGGGGAGSSDESDSRDGEETSGDVNCASDAMICPDGTAVGREGPNCEFAPCPGDGGLECTEGAYFAPACDAEGPELFEPGCFRECNPDAEDCDPGSTCQLINYNPCICEADGEGCCDACGAQTYLCMPETEDLACAAVSGTFLSVDEQECGLKPGGVAMCRWRITFSDDGTYSWMYSDVGAEGTFDCEAGELVTLDRTMTQGSYDPKADTLIWAGLPYERSTE